MPEKTPTHHQRMIKAGRRAATPQGSHDQVNARRIRQSSKWTARSRRLRTAYPLCADPYEVHDPPVVNALAHHIESAAARPDLAHQWTNLAPLCDECHARIERDVSAGLPTAHLFAEHLATRDQGGPGGVE